MDNSKKTISYSFHLGMDLLAAIMAAVETALPKHLEDDLLERRYLRALQKEGWSAKANGSCQIMSISFTSEEDQDRFLKALQGEGLDKILNIAGTEIAKAGGDRDAFKTKVPFINVERFSQDGDFPVIVPLSRYDDVMAILKELDIDHDMQDYQKLDDPFTQDKIDDMIANKTIYDAVTVYNADPDLNALGSNAKLEDLDLSLYFPGKSLVLTAKETGRSNFDDIKEYQEALAAAGIRCKLLTGDKHAESDLEKIDRIILSYQDKLRLDEFNVVNSVDINYDDSKKMDIAFDPATHQLIISNQEQEGYDGKPFTDDGTYEFEPYLDEAGFQYTSQNGTIVIDLDEEANEKAMVQLAMDNRIHYRSKNAPLAADLGDAFGRIKEEDHPSGAGQFSFKEIGGSRAYAEWLSKNITKHIDDKALSASNRDYFADQLDTVRNKIMSDSHTEQDVENLMQCAEIGTSVAALDRGYQHYSTKEVFASLDQLLEAAEENPAVDQVLDAGFWKKQLDSVKVMNRYILSDSEEMKRCIKKLAEKYEDRSQEGSKSSIQVAYGASKEIVYADETSVITDDTAVEYHSDVETMIACADRLYVRVKEGNKETNDPQISRLLDAYDDAKEILNNAWISYNKQKDQVALDSYQKDVDRFIRRADALLEVYVPEKEDPGKSTPDIDVDTPSFSCKEYFDNRFESMKPTIAQEGEQSIDAFMGACAEVGPAITALDKAYASKDVESALVALDTIKSTAEANPMVDRVLDSNFWAHQVSILKNLAGNIENERIRESIAEIASKYEQVKNSERFDDDDARTAEDAFTMGDNDDELEREFGPSGEEENEDQEQDQPEFEEEEDFPEEEEEEGENKTQRRSRRRKEFAGRRRTAEKIYAEDAKRVEDENRRQEENRQRRQADENRRAEERRKQEEERRRSDKQAEDRKKYDEEQTKAYQEQAQQTGVYGDGFGYPESQPVQDGGYPDSSYQEQTYQESAQTADSTDSGSYGAAGGLATAEAAGAAGSAYQESADSTNQAASSSSTDDAVRAQEYEERKKQAEEEYQKAQEDTRLAEESRDNAIRYEQNAIAAQAVAQASGDYEKIAAANQALEEAKNARAAAEQSVFDAKAAESAAESRKDFVAHDYTGIDTGTGYDPYAHKPEPKKYGTEDDNRSMFANRGAKGTYGTNAGGFESSSSTASAPAGGHSNFRVTNASGSSYVSEEGSGSPAASSGVGGISSSTGSGESGSAFSGRSGVPDPYAHFAENTGKRNVEGGKQGSRNTSGSKQYSGSGYSYDPRTGTAAPKTYKASDEKNPFAGNVGKKKKYGSPESAESENTKPIKGEKVAAGVAGAGILAGAAPSAAVAAATPGVVKPIGTGADIAGGKKSAGGSTSGGGSAHVVGGKGRTRATINVDRDVQLANRRKVASEIGVNLSGKVKRVGEQLSRPLKEELNKTDAGQAVREIDGYARPFKKAQRIHLQAAAELKRYRRAYGSLAGNFADIAAMHDGTVSSLDLLAGKYSGRFTSVGNANLMGKRVRVTGVDDVGEDISQVIRNYKMTAKDAKQLLKDINIAAYSMGFPTGGWRGIKDFNQLVRSGRVEEYIREGLRKGSITRKQAKDIKKMAKMSKDASILSQGLHGQLLKHLRMFGAVTGGIAGTSLRQTEGIGAALMVKETIGRGYSTARMLLRTGNTIGRLTFKTIAGSSKAIKATKKGISSLRNANAVLRRKWDSLKQMRNAVREYVVRNGGKRGALKAGAKVVGKNARIASRRVGARIGTRAMHSGIGRAALKVGHTAERMGAGVSYLHRHGIRGSVRFIKKDAGSRISMFAARKAGSVRRAGRKVRNAGRWVRGLKTGGAKGLTVRAIRGAGKAAVKGVAGAGKALGAILTKLKPIVIGVGVFVLIIFLICIVTMFGQLSQEGVQWIKQTGKSIVDYRGDIDDPRNDTVMGRALTHLDAMDYIFYTGTKEILGGVNTVEDVLAKVPFVGPLIHQKQMNLVQTMTAAEMNYNVYFIFDDLVETSDSYRLKFYQDTPLFVHDAPDGSGYNSSTIHVQNDKIEAETDHFYIRTWMTTAFSPSDDLRNVYLNGRSLQDVKKDTPILRVPIQDMQAVNESIEIQYVDGDGYTSSQMSNIRQILSLSSVVFGDTTLGTDNISSTYADGTPNDLNQTMNDTKLLAAVGTSVGTDNALLKILKFLDDTASGADTMHKINYIGMGTAIEYMNRLFADAVEDYLRNYCYEHGIDWHGFPDGTSNGLVYDSYCIAVYIASHDVKVGYLTDSTGGTVLDYCDAYGLDSGIAHNVCMEAKAGFWYGIYEDNPADADESYNPRCNGWTWKTENGNHAAPYDWSDLVRPMYGDAHVDSWYAGTNKDKFFAMCCQQYFWDRSPIDGSVADGLPDGYKAYGYMCTGHPHIVCVVSTKTMDTGLFEAVENSDFCHAAEACLKDIEGIFFPVEWAEDTSATPAADGMIHWTDNNRDWARWQNDIDYEQAYGLYVGQIRNSSRHILTRKQLASIALGLRPAELSFERYYMLYKGLQTVGVIPYGDSNQLDSLITFNATTGACEAAVDMYGEPVLPDHLSNISYITWLFAVGGMDLSMNQTRPTEMGDITSLMSAGVINYLGDGAICAPGDIMASEANAFDNAIEGHPISEFGVFLGYEEGSSNTIGYILEEYAWDIDKVTMPDSTEQVYNIYGGVIIKRIKMNDGKWLGFRPTCYKEPPFKENPGTIDSYNIHNMDFLPDTLNPEVDINNTKDDQEDSYRNWDASH